MRRVVGVVILFLIVVSTLVTAASPGAFAQAGSADGRAAPFIKITSPEDLSTITTDVLVASVSYQSTNVNTYYAKEIVISWVLVVDSPLQSKVLARGDHPIGVKASSGSFQITVNLKDAGADPERYNLKVFMPTYPERGGFDPLRDLLGDDVSFYYSPPFTREQPTSQFALNLASDSLDIYPTESNYTVAKVKYQGAALKSPILLKVAESLPPGLTVSFIPAQVQPENNGVSDLMINVTMDYSKAKGLVPPADYKLTIVAASGDLQASAVLSVHLLKAKWLVMLYFAADDKELENPMGYNIADMGIVSEKFGTPKVGLMVLFDSLKNDAGLVQFVDGKPKVISTLGPTDMSSSGTLRSFVLNAMRKIPAEHNHLIMGGHGSGMKGVITDHNQGKGYMKVSDMAKAINNLDKIPGISVSKLDVISFDACLMGQIEVLYHLKDHADFFTASERTVPGYGYAYDRFLEEVSRRPEITPLEYVRLIVQSYGSKYDGSSSKYLKANATLSAVDSSKLTDLASKIDSLAKALRIRYQAHDSAFNKTVHQDVTKSEEADGMHYTDIRDFAQNILDDPKITDAKIKEAARGVVKAVDSAVVANTQKLFDSKSNPIQSRYFGLTIFLLPVFTSPPEVDPTLSVKDLELLKELSFAAISPVDIFRDDLKHYKESAFAGATDWEGFLRDYAFSIDPADATVTLNTGEVVTIDRTFDSVAIIIRHPAHELYLHVYDAKGRHIGFNPSLINQSRWPIDLQIPESLYIDYKNGTKAILLPTIINEFKVVVDGQRMEEDKELYELLYSVVKNRTLTYVKVLEGNIEQNTVQSMPVKMESGQITIGETSISKVNVTNRSVANSTSIVTSQIVTSKRSTDQPPQPSPFQVTDSEIGLGIVALIGIVGAALILRRRSKTRPAKPGASSQPSVAEEVQPPPVQNRVVTGARFCSNCGTSLSPDKAFCSNCGARVKVE